MKREDIDMHSVPEHQRAIHERLVNWARWVEVRPHYAMSPMFRIMGYRSNSRQWHAPEIRPMVDLLDALAVEKTMRHLPEKNRTALQWHYLYACLHLGKVCKFIGVSKEGLQKLVVDARQMVDNRLHRV